MNKLKDNKGAILIVAYVALYALITLSVGISMFNFSELNFARRYRHSVMAFWLAEYGVNMFMKNTSLLDKENPLVIEEEEGEIHLKKDDSDPSKRVVMSTGIVDGIKRSIEISYPSNPPEVFRNTISVKGNIEILGSRSMVSFNDKTRLSGRVSDNSKISNVAFEDIQDNAHPRLVSLSYPDANLNGQQDEFDDFVQFNRNLISRYPKEEVLYLQGNGTYTFTPSTSLEGKKIVYIEGQEGKGNVIIQFGGGLKRKQNLTIITTGNVLHNQAGWATPQSQLNIIAWSGYTETAALPGSHHGFIYTHGVANFDDIYDTSVTYGGIAANGGMTLREVWSMKTFHYAQTTKDNLVPPGFEGLLGGGTTGYTARPDSWRSTL